MLKSTFGKQKLIPIPGSGRGPVDKTLPDEPGLKCPSCSRRLKEKEVKEQHKLCPHCGYHFPLNVWERVEIMTDPDSFREFGAGLRSFNILDFPGYDEKLAQAIDETGLSEAFITGYNYSAFGQVYHLCLIICVGLCSRGRLSFHLNQEERPLFTELQSGFYIFNYIGNLFHFF
jgi:RNA polymerase subunit RPABC4/transcription elongation factor Spt4